jgi:hypothetical protein
MFINVLCLDFFNIPICQFIGNNLFHIGFDWVANFVRSCPFYACIQSQK